MDTGVRRLAPGPRGSSDRHVNFEPAWVFDQIQDGDARATTIAEATGNPVDTHRARDARRRDHRGHRRRPGRRASTSAASRRGQSSSISRSPIARPVRRDIGWEVNALAAYEWAIEHRNDKAFPGGIRIVSNSWSIYEADSNAEPITLIVKAADERPGSSASSRPAMPGPEPNTVAVGPNRLPRGDHRRGSVQERRLVRRRARSRASRAADRRSTSPRPGDNVFSTVSFASVDGRAGSLSRSRRPQYAPYYVGLSGTSMADTARGRDRRADARRPTRSCRATACSRSSSATAHDRGTPGFDHAWGHGLVDAPRCGQSRRSARRARPPPRRAPSRAGPGSRACPPDSGRASRRTARASAPCRTRGSPSRA